MHYEALAKDCRWLGIHAHDFQDPQTLALALERTVDASNAPQVVMLLWQIASEEFDVVEARRAYEGLRFDFRPPKFVPWTERTDGADCAFFCGSELETQRFRGWIASLDVQLWRELRDFFETRPHRFLLSVDPFSSSLGDRISVQLGVRDAAMELSYSLPDRFELDSDPARANATARSLLRHLKIGTLYHEILAAGRDGGVDASRILSLLAGDTRRSASEVVPTL
jgi:hypothetical protein